MTLEMWDPQADNEKVTDDSSLSLKVCKDEKRRNMRKRWDIYRTKIHGKRSDAFV